ncbi:aldo/keto reductase [Planctomicrobium sp. SH664]|uniref:aldo/keto reductase n=1 Tax=Planctomicrobium sp. SH664 TaxID=3448125 RepID=UPI003F5B5B46
MRAFPMMHSVTLSSGRQLPSVGLGFWKVPRPRAAGLVVEAIEAGYRHLDCAADYGNEAEVGEGLQRALQKGLCRREDLWVTSKLWNTYHRPEHVRPALERTLRDLRLDFLDLYLIHFPIALKFVPFEQRYPPEWFFDPNAPAPRMEPDPVPLLQTWEAMKELVTAGLVREIGVSNFSVALLRELAAGSGTTPAVLQVELHPLLTQEKLLRYCREQGIAVTGFSPLGAQSYVSINMAGEEDSLLSNDSVRQIAQGHGRTAAQVLLRWGVQRGTAVVPKTSRRERLVENLQIFDFELSAEEMQKISHLNQNRRFNDPGVFCEGAFQTFFPIYE